MNCARANVRLVPIIISALALGACTHVGVPSAHAANPWTQHGLLRIGSRQTPDNLNVELGTQTVDNDLSAFWAGYLFRWNDHDNFEPELAVRVPTIENGDISRDGLNIRYHLRRNVFWQDGAPFTADDVIYTWRQMLDPDNAVVSRLGYDIVSRIDKRDAYTIDVHLKHRFAPFVATFFALAASHSDAILPKHLLASYSDLNHLSFNSLPVGTGPFRVASDEKGSKIVFVANDRYWRGPPRLRRIEYRIVENDNTLLALLRSHDIDFYYRPTESQADILRHVAGVRLVTAPFTRWADLGFNAKTPQLSDVRVRRALFYAVDRAALIAKVTHGMALPARSDQPPFSWAYEPDVMQYSYDPKRAMQLLEEAGWHTGADGVRVNNGKRLQLDLVSFTGSATANTAEVVLQDAWRRIGADIAIRNYSSSQLYETRSAGGIEQAGKFDVIFENWANGTDPDDSILFRCDMAPPAGWNVYGLCDRALDEAETVAMTSYDRSTRKKMYARIQRIIAAQLPIAILWYQEQLDAINTDFKNYRPAHAITPFWNTWEWST